MRTILTLLVVNVGIIVTAHATRLDHPPGVFGCLRIRPSTVPACRIPVTPPVIADDITQVILGRLAADGRLMLAVAASMTAAGPA